MMRQSKKRQKNLRRIFKLENSFTSRQQKQTIKNEFDTEVRISASKDMSSTTPTCFLKSLLQPAIDELSTFSQKETWSKKPSNQLNSETMYFVFQFLIVLSVSSFAFSQTVVHNATISTTSNYMFGFDTAIDSQGSFQFIGDYYASTNFGGSTLTTNSNIENIWLAKYDNLFRYLSSTGLGNPSLANTPRGVEFDSEDSMIMVGGTKGGLDFGSGAFTSAGGWDIFIAKAYPVGTWQWANVYGSTSDDVYVILVRLLMYAGPLVSPSLQTTLSSLAGIFLEASVLVV